MEIKTVRVVGQGALGTMFGRQMANNMPQGSLQFIASPQRARRYKEEGVYANGQLCNFSYISPGSPASAPDLIIFAVKATALSAAIQDAQNHVGENTIILSLLNGITSEEELGAAFGVEKVLYCVAQGMDATKIGNQLTYQNMGLLSFGEKDSAQTPRVEAVARFFKKVGIAYEQPADMQHKMWSKFMLNVGVNQAATVFETDYGALQQPGPGRTAMLDAMREVMQIAQCKGVALTVQDIDYWMGVIDKLSPAGMPSMRQDALEKRRGEVELFAGTVMRLGKETGIATPVNAYFYAAVNEMEKGYA